MSAFRAVEAVVDNVDHIREKYETTRARHAAAPPVMESISAEVRPDALFDQRSAYSFDTAVAIYGVQLRAWIDMQVDARIQQTLAGLVEGELISSRQESTTALATSGRLEREVRSSTDAQAKMLVVVEGIAEEMARLKAAVTACQLGTQLNAVRSNSSWDEMRIARHEAALDELRKDVQRLQDEVQRNQQRFSAELSEALGVFATKREVDGLFQTVQQLEAKIPAALREFKQEITELRAEMTAAFQREAAAVVALDEQVWLTDQRLGQRIDELMQIHVRERDTIVVREPAPIIRSEVVPKEVHVPETIHIRPRVTETVNVHTDVIDHHAAHKETVHIRPRIVDHSRDNAHIETHVTEHIQQQDPRYSHTEVHGGMKEAIHIRPKLGQSTVTHIEQRETIDSEAVTGHGSGSGAHIHVTSNGHRGSAAEVMGSESYHTSHAVHGGHVTQF
mmetsp:Transcript_54488/g.129898  ORF Transcript_54488/g.129898 Transcript_54488/m.129898 type:complete len:449 (-) Transcript_54488:177-1523(-)